MINRELLVSIPHTKGGKYFWTCVKDHIIEENDDYEAIGLRGFDYILFEEEEGEGVRERLDGYPYLKHLIKLWTGDYVKHMSEMNEMAGVNNCLLIYGGKKRTRLVRPFIRQKL